MAKPRRFWEGTSPHIALTAFDINNSGSGAIIDDAPNATDNGNQTQWQLVPLAPTNAFVIRSKYLGSQWYMGTFWNPANTAPGTETHLNSQTYSKPNLVPAEAQWIIRPSNESASAYYFSTVENTTELNLAVYGSAAYLRDAGTATSANQFDWSFSAVSKINNAQRSYTPTATPSTSSSTTRATSTATSTGAASSSTSTNSPTATPQPLSHSGTPTDAIAGGVIGALLFWGRKRRQQKQARADGTFDKPELEDNPVFSSRFGTTLKDQPAPYGAAMPVKSGPATDVYEKPARTSDEGRASMYQGASELPADPRSAR